MNPYDSLCDDFYINMYLNTEMDLPTNRDTVLHFFERIRKSYPEMRSFYQEDGGFMLENEDNKGRWCKLESQEISSGHIDPESVEDAIKQHSLILELAPYMLSVSPLDCECLDIIYGFDYTVKGNQNQIVADVLGVSPSMNWLNDLAVPVSYEPMFTVALDEECFTQFRLKIKTTTDAYQIRTEDYSEESISVLATARKYGSLGPDETFIETLQQLSEICQDMIGKHVAEAILGPLNRL